MIKLIRIFFLSISVTFLASCSFLSPVKLETTNTYLLNSLPSHVASRHTHAITLLVTQPETRPVYNTRQMAYTIKPYQVSYFGQNQWAETPGQMLQLLLVQTLQDTHYFRAIVTQPYGGRYTYALNTQILKIEQDYTRFPVMRIMVNAQIIQAITNQVIATKQFSIAVPMSQRAPYAGVIAANAGMPGLLKRIADFCLVHGR